MNSSYFLIRESSSSIALISFGCSFFWTFRTGDTDATFCYLDLQILTQTVTTRTMLTRHNVRKVCFRLLQGAERTVYEVRCTTSIVDAAVKRESICRFSGYYFNSIHSFTIVLRRGLTTSSWSRIHLQLCHSFLSWRHESLMLDILEDTTKRKPSRSLTTLIDRLTGRCRRHWLVVLMILFLPIQIIR